MNLKIVLYHIYARTIFYLLFLFTIKSNVSWYKFSKSVKCLLYISKSSTKRHRYKLNNLGYIKKKFVSESFVIYFYLLYFYVLKAMCILRISFETKTINSFQRPIHLLRQCHDYVYYWPAKLFNRNPIIANVSIFSPK